MSGVSEDFIEKLKDTVDIVDVVSDYVALKKTGKNYKGLCPFHQEKTPSFTINPDKQFYYCFGCGAGGNVFNFLMEIEHITFQETLKILAKRAGLEIPHQSSHEKRIMVERDRLFEINQVAAKFYHYLLMEKEIAAKAVEYLKKRGFTREDMESFYLGYAPPGWRSLLNFMTGRGYQQEELLKAGLVLTNNNNSYYDRFRDRIIFPIFNLRGEVLAFGGRIINSTVSNTPKYLNSPDTLIYKKGENLYGFNWARDKIRETDSAIMMEGYTDVLSAHKAGITNAVASLGTALTVEQAKFLKRYAQTIFIAYDADAAGTSATLRGLDILKKAGLNVRVINLPENTDPDDFIREQGKKEFARLQEEACSLIDFKIEQIVKGKDLTKTDEKVNLTREIVQLLAGLEDKIEREVYLQEIADRFQLNFEVLREEVARVSRDKDSKKKDKNYQNRYTKKDNETNSLNNINRLEKIILKYCIDNPELREQILPQFFTATNRKLARLILDNSAKDIRSVIDKIEDEDLRKKALALTMAEGETLSPVRLRILVDKLIYRNKIGIYRELQDEEGLSLTKLNNLLIYFQQLSNYQGKEGF